MFDTTLHTDADTEERQMSPSCHDDLRMLTQNEREVLVSILELEDPRYAAQLIKQAIVAKAVLPDEGPNWIELRVPVELVIELPMPSPLTAGARVVSDSGEVIGGLLVWTNEGLLIALEFWPTDCDANAPFPNVSQVTPYRSVQDITSD